MASKKRRPARKAAEHGGHTGGSSKSHGVVVIVTIGPIERIERKSKRRGGSKVSRAELRRILREAARRV